MLASILLNATCIPYHSYCTVQWPVLLMISFILDGSIHLIYAAVPDNIEKDSLNHVTHDVFGCLICHMLIYSIHTYVNTDKITTYNFIHPADSVIA